MALRPQPKRSAERKTSAQPRTPPVGKALELGIQFGGCVVVGVGLGYYLDRWLGTTPLLLFVFMLFGFAAGVRTLFRFAQASSAPGPSTGDDSAPDEAPPRQETKE